jgi:uncharacterized protein YjbJ (UPF0337 family)
MNLAAYTEKQAPVGAMRASVPLLKAPGRRRYKAHGVPQVLVREGRDMNKDILQGKWRQMRGEMKQWWGKITDDEFDKIEGNRDKLIGILQEKYGYSREKAEEEMGRRFETYERPVRG